LQITGHDVGSYADLLRARDGFRILDIAELQALPDAQFDVISLVEVIEHIEYPSPVIALISRLLRPGGLLLLTSGNNDCPVARRDGLAYRYYLPEIHVGIFNPRSLALLYTRHGLLPRPVRYAGVIKFKVLKSLVQPLRRSLARFALRLPFVVRWIDLAYGVSAMPCAVKPLRLTLLSLHAFSPAASTTDVTRTLSVIVPIFDEAATLRTGARRYRRQVGRRLGARTDLH